MNKKCSSICVKTRQFENYIGCYISIDVSLIAGFLVSSLEAKVQGVPSNLAVFLSGYVP